MSDSSQKPVTASAKSDYYSPKVLAQLRRLFSRRRLRQLDAFTLNAIEDSQLVKMLVEEHGPKCPDCGGPTTINGLNEILCAGKIVCTRSSAFGTHTPVGWISPKMIEAMLYAATRAETAPPKEDKPCAES